MASRPLALPGLSPATERRQRLLRSLPDPHDRRYPRAWWFRLLRGSARVWWLPLAFYLAHGVTALAAVATSAGLSSAMDGTHLARALLIAPVWPTLTSLPLSTLALVGSLVFAVVTIGVLCCLQLARLAANDTLREAEVLLVRNVRSAERGDGAWMWRAFAPALEWRLRSLRWRGRMLRVGLLVAAIAAGVLLGLGALPVGIIQ